jgi:hypothetical protein
VPAANLCSSCYQAATTSAGLHCLSQAKPAAAAAAANSPTGRQQCSSKQMNQHKLLWMALTASQNQFLLLLMQLSVLRVFVSQCSSSSSSQLQQQ